MNFVKEFLKPNIWKVLLPVVIVVPAILDTLGFDFIPGGFFYALFHFAFIVVPTTVLSSIPLASYLNRFLGPSLSVLIEVAILWYLISCLMYFVLTKIKNALFSGARAQQDLSL